MQQHGYGLRVNKITPIVYYLTRTQGDASNSDAIILRQKSRSSELCYVFRQRSTQLNLSALSVTVNVLNYSHVVHAHISDRLLSKLISF